VLPPLRERTDDIPHLAKHFVHKFAGRMGKPVRHIPDEVIEELLRHDWPGNIRELQNVIERGVITSSGPDLLLGEFQHRCETRNSSTSAIRTLADAEREHILAVLRQVRGVIGGRNGAASRLGLPRTTLLYRMCKLGISQPKAEARTFDSGMSDWCPSASPAESAVRLDRLSDPDKPFGENEAAVRGNGSADAISEYV